MGQQRKEEWENEGGSTSSPLIESSTFSKRWIKEIEKCLKHYNKVDDYFDHDFHSVLITIKKVMTESNQRFGLINPDLSKSIIKAVDFILKKKISPASQ